MAKLIRSKITTGYCGCPLNAETDCRFHSRSEPGWEKCPNEKFPKGRNLWATMYTDAETGEVVDKKEGDVVIETVDTMEDLIVESLEA